MAMTSAERSAGDGTVRPLAQVLTYRNDLVVRRFRKRFDLSGDEADAVFVELLRWLWYLASTSSTPDNPEAHAIDEPLVVIDEMWHDFILITQDYTTFCDDMFGRYIHHAPARPDDRLPRPEGLDEVKAALAALIGRKRAKYTAIYDVLGRDIFALWYLNYPQKFSADALSLMRRETGHVSMAPRNPIGDQPGEDQRDKEEVIEEALFLNLLLSSPDAIDTQDEEGGAAGQQGIMT